MAMVIAMAMAWDKIRIWIRFMIKIRILEQHDLGRVDELPYPL